MQFLYSLQNIVKHPAGREKAKVVTSATHYESRKTTEGMFGQGCESITCLGAVVGNRVLSFVRGCDSFTHRGTIKIWTSQWVSEVALIYVLLL